jgi:hypothetical protein
MDWTCINIDRVVQHGVVGCGGVFERPPWILD